MSKVARFSSARQIEVEACAWIAQLDGNTPSRQDLAAFREWVNRSPQHREEIRRLSALWSELNLLTELAIPMKQPKPALGRNWRMCTAVFAALALASVFASLIHWRVQTSADRVAGPSLFYVTGIGEQKPVVLADGSKVLMNTQSRMEIVYSPHQRSVHLLQGEGYFEVAHDRNRPFVVYAGANTVRAVGTAFSVQVKKHDVEVVVTEGTVELSAVDGRGVTRQIKQPSKAAVTELAAIKAGQSATFNRDVESIQSVNPSEIKRKLSWRDGVLSFSGEPLEQVVQEVTRYTPVAIVITDPAIRQVRIGGYFKVGEIDAMLEALDSSFGVRVNRVNDRLVYLAAK